MRFSMAVSRTVALAAALAVPGICQIDKEIALGVHVARDLELRDGRLVDTIVSTYLDELEKKLAAGAGLTPLEIRLTKSPDDYATLLPGRVLYVSAGLILRAANEAELAGLLAHELAHSTTAKTALQSRSIITRFGDCVLTSPIVPLGWSESMRDSEGQANTVAIGSLRAARYDPAGMLEFLSKLAIEHPSWAKALPPEDLLHARAFVDSEDVPAMGYIVGRAEFVDMRSRLNVLLGRRPLSAPPSLERSGG